MEARLQYMSMINKSCIYCGILRGKEGIYGWIIYRKIQNIDRNLIRWTNRLVAELMKGLVIVWSGTISRNIKNNIIKVIAYLHIFYIETEIPLLMVNC